MAHIEQLTKYLLKPGNIKHILCNKNKYILLNAYIDILEKIWLNNNKVYSPINFKNLIGEMNPLFKEIKANDSKYLIIFLIETMHKELNTAKNIIQIHIKNIYNIYNYEETFQTFSEMFKL